MSIRLKPVPLSIAMMMISLMASSIMMPVIPWTHVTDFRAIILIAVNAILVQLLRSRGQYLSDAHKVLLIQSALHPLFVTELPYYCYRFRISGRLIAYLTKTEEWTRLWIRE